MNKFWSQLERLTGWLLYLFSLTHSRSIIHSFITIGPHSSCLWSRNNADITDDETARPWGAGEMDHIFESKENHSHPLDLYRTKLCSQSKDQDGTWWTLSRQFYQSLLEAMKAEQSMVHEWRWAQHSSHLLPRLHHYRHSHWLCPGCL